MQESEQFQSLYFFVFLKLESEKKFRFFSTKRKILHFIKMSKKKVKDVKREREIRGETLSGEFP